jgi:rubrerythrin
MSVIETVRDIFAASTQSANRGEDQTVESEGAYWCHDCEERILDLNVEGETPPECPSCGDAMEFERSPGTTGCAC